MLSPIIDFIHELLNYFFRELTKIIATISQPLVLLFLYFTESITFCVKYFYTEHFYLTMALTGLFSLWFFFHLWKNYYYVDKDVNRKLSKKEQIELYYELIKDLESQLKLLMVIGVSLDTLRPADLDFFELNATKKEIDEEIEKEKK